jgi:SPW repeat
LAGDRALGLGFGSLAVAAWNRVIVGLLVPAFAAWRLWDVSQKATA